MGPARMIVESLTPRPGIRERHQNPLALAKDAPVSRPIQRTRIMSSHPILGGLHHHYVRVQVVGTHTTSSPLRPGIGFRYTHPSAARELYAKN